MDVLTGLCEGDFENVVEDSESEADERDERATSEVARSIRAPSAKLPACIEDEKSQEAEANLEAQLRSATRAANPEPAAENEVPTSSRLRVRTWKVAGYSKANAPDSTLQVIEDPEGTLVVAGIRGMIIDASFS
jgi:hypothetical protein